MPLEIRKARRSKAWLKIALEGVSGSGKTYSALRLAQGIGNDPKVLLIDTENGSGELYSHLYEYDYIRLEPPFSPAKYVEAIGAAIANGNNVIIVDSLTHCWKYILAYKESLDTANPKAGFTNWTKAKLLFDEVKTALLQCPAHTFVTLRSGSEYAESYDARGNKKFEKVGTKPIAEPDIEYEFTLALRIERSHLATAVKDRTERFDIATPFTPSPTHGQILYNWLMEGEGELGTTWSGALQGEDAVRALEEASRLGVGVEGSSESEIAARAKELLAVKRREAVDIMKRLGIYDEKGGMEGFKERAKAEGLDPLELFWEFSKKREGLKSWSEYLAVLEEYIDNKHATENPPASTVTEGGEEPKAEEPTTPEGGQGTLAVDIDPKAVEKLRKEFNRSNSRGELELRIAALGAEIDGLLAEALGRDPKANLAAVVAVIEELETKVKAEE